MLKCQQINICWHFNVYEHDKFHAQSRVEHEKITSGMVFKDLNFYTIKVIPLPEGYSRQIKG